MEQHHSDDDEETSEKSSSTEKEDKSNVDKRRLSNGNMGQRYRTLTDNEVNS